MSTKLNLTKRTIEALPIPSDGRQEYRDTNDRYIRIVISSEGRRSWRYVRKVSGRVRFLTIGTYPEVTPDMARRQSREYTVEFEAGRDPGLAKQTRRNAMTWVDLFEWYMENHAKPHKRTWKYDQEMEARYCRAWRKLNWHTITSDVVTQWHKRLGSTNGKHQADRALSMVKTVFSKALTADIIQGRNPAVAVSKFFTKTDEFSRDRHLDGPEISRLLASLIQHHDQDIADFFMVCLFTGARRGNVMSMRWEHLKNTVPDNATWEIPAEQSKNKAPQRIAIVDPVISILSRRYENRRSDDWVFPARLGSKSGHITEPKKAWASICKKAKLDNVRIHDLRRTLGSWQASLGSSLQIIGKSLGHRSTKSTEIYARLDIDPIRASVSAASTAMLSAAKNNENTVNGSIEKTTPQNGESMKNIDA